jgi:hypothetical protein
LPSPYPTGRASASYPGVLFLSQDGHHLGASTRFVQACKQAFLSTRSSSNGECIFCDYALPPPIFQLSRKQRKQRFVLHGKQIIEASSLRYLHVCRPSPAVDWCRWVSRRRRRRPVGIAPHVALLPPAAESSRHCLAAHSQGHPPACAAGARSLVLDGYKTRSGSTWVRRSCTRRWASAKRASTRQGSSPATW